MQVLIKDSLANLLGFCEKFPLKTFENSFSSLPLSLCLCHQQWLTCIPSSSNFRNWPDCQAPSSPVMHLLVSLLLLLLLGSVEPRRGPRSKAVERGTRGHVRGRGRAGVMRRQTEVCLEYMESGEKYLDCQDRQLTTVMQDWPKDIHHLLLARNRIQVFTDSSPGAKITTDVNYSGLEIFFFLQEIGFFAAIKPELSIHNLLLSMLQMACWCHEHLCTSYLGARSKTDFSSLCVQIFACLSKYRMFMSQVLRELKQNVSLQVNKWKWLSNRHWWKQWKQV